MFERATHIRRGSVLRQPGTSSYEWHRAGTLPIAAGGASIALWLAITATFALAAWVLP